MRADALFRLSDSRAVFTVSRMIASSAHWGKTLRRVIALAPALAAVAIPGYAVAASAAQPTASHDIENTTVLIFGPQRFSRTAGSPNRYDLMVSVPAWIAAPYRMHVQSGEPDG